MSNKSLTFTNRCTYVLVLESTKIYIKIYTKMLLHVSVYDHHQEAYAATPLHSTKRRTFTESF